MEIKVLGTVSPYCKDEKNCPGYLVTSKEAKVLLDCGNGITRNLNLPADLENLSIIISHLHKDHYGELLSLGYASYVFKNLGYLTERIKVYLPEPETYEDGTYYSDGWGGQTAVKKKLIDYELLEKFGDEQFLEFITYKPTDQLKIGDLNIKFKQNPHQIKTFAAKITENDDTFVYSSDTGYYGNSVTELAKDADLLLCESTYIKGQAKITDNHLYAHEAGKIAEKANVKKLMLTHFFPEIDKELYVTEAKEIFKNTEAAEEGKVYKIGGKK